MNNLACHADEYLLIPECFWEPWRFIFSKLRGGMLSCSIVGRSMDANPSFLIS